MTDRSALIMSAKDLADARMSVLTLRNLIGATLAGKGHDPILDGAVCGLLGWGQKMNVSGKPGGNLTPPLTASGDAVFDLAEFRLGAGYASGAIHRTMPGGKDARWEAIFSTKENEGLALRGRVFHPERGRAALGALLQLICSTIEGSIIASMAAEAGEDVGNRWWTQFRPDVNASYRDWLMAGNAPQLEEYLRRVHPALAVATPAGNA